jgi:type VI secretion system protein ImpA
MSPASRPADSTKGSIVPIINVDSLLKPLSADSPCGENLRYKFSDLERLSEGKPEDPFNNTPAEEPNWREVADKSKEYFTRGKHLAIAAILTTAAVRLEGYPGLRDGLRLVYGMLRDYWEPIFPQLDVEDNNDPTERINSLAALSAPPGTTSSGPRLLDRVLEAPLCDSRQLGRFSLWDIRYSGGQIKLSEQQMVSRPPRSISEIDGAFLETDKEKLAEILAAIKEAMVAAQGIDQIFSEKLGSGRGLDLKPLLELLKDASLQIERRTAGGDLAAGDTGSETSGAALSAGPALSGEVRSREDARLALDKVIRYFETNEPSSPVPMMVKSAQEMIGRSFRDISKIMNQDAVRTYEQIAYPEENS